MTEIAQSIHDAGLAIAAAIVISAVLRMFFNE